MADKEATRVVFHKLIHEVVDVLTNDHPDVPEVTKYYDWRHVPNAGPLVTFAARSKESHVCCIIPSGIHGSITLVVDGVARVLSWWVGWDDVAREAIICCGPEPV